MEAWVCMGSNPWISLPGRVLGSQVVRAMMYGHDEIINFLVCTPSRDGCECMWLLTLNPAAGASFLLMA